MLQPPHLAPQHAPAAANMPTRWRHSAQSASSPSTVGLPERPGLSWHTVMPTLKHPDVRSHKHNHLLRSQKYTARCRGWLLHHSLDLGASTHSRCIPCFSIIGNKNMAEFWKKELNSKSCCKENATQGLAMACFLLIRNVQIKLSSAI